MIPQTVAFVLYGWMTKLFCPELLAACIASEGADQCGFCTTGMMMSAINLKRKNPKASDDEIREYLIGNLCRCTGYESQLRGVRKFLEGGL